MNAEPNFPTALDQAVIARDKFRQQALARHGNSLNGFEDAAFDWLIQAELTPEQRRQLLSRLTRPDHPNLVQLVVADLNYQNSGGFGSMTIHAQMLKSQLDALLEGKPELLTQQNFVLAYLRKLQPSPDIDWRHDKAELRKYLERLRQFAERLVPSHNSLKAHVLYHLLLLDRSEGKYDKNLFLDYVKLPRNVFYISKAIQESDVFRRFPCDLNSNYNGATLLIPIVSDEPLVRSYLAQFFLEAKNTREFEAYINSDYLKHLFAETKIVNGLGEPEQWAAMLPPELFRQLKDRVDLDFDAANKTDFAADDPVSLDLHVKNVSTLIVKVFEINAKNFYRQTGKEVDTDINLDGLVANAEQSHKYDESPFRRRRAPVRVPDARQAGRVRHRLHRQGKSSRALIRKGRLSHLVRTTPAGQMFTVLDENEQQVKDAALCLGVTNTGPTRTAAFTSRSARTPAGSRSSSPRPFPAKRVRAFPRSASSITRPKSTSSPPDFTSIAKRC